MFFTLFWVFGVLCVGGGGSPNRLVRNLLMQFFTTYSSRVKACGTHIVDIVATHNDHPSFVHVFFTLFWVFGVLCVGGGGLPIDWYATCLCSFSPHAAQESKLVELTLLILWPPTMIIQALFSMF